MLRLYILFLLVHVICLLSFVNLYSLRLIVLRNLAHAVLAKVQAAFNVEEVRSVKFIFKSSRLTHSFPSISTVWVRYVSVVFLCCSNIVMID